MLAQDYDSNAGRVKYPCFVQPKLDGVRLIASVSAAGEVELRTRNGKAVDEAAFDALASRLKTFLRPGLYLDGEMYSHGETFEEVVSKFKHGSAALSYWIYDLYDAHRADLGTAERMAALSDLLERMSRLKLQGVRAVETRRVATADEVASAHDEYAAMGFEGVMVRDAGAPYEPGKRSRALLKLKAFQTDEFAVVDVVEAEGLDAGTAVFVCEAVQGKEKKTFNVRMRASREARREHLLAFRRDPSAFVGKKLTVRFQQLTANGIPRFPVGLALRDYE